MVDYLLYESATGYSLFDVVGAEEVAGKTKEVQLSLQDLSKFGKVVQLRSFVPFKNAAHALENANDVSEGVMNEYLKGFLELNLPKASKKKKISLGVQDKNLASSIKGELEGIECDTSDLAQDLLRGIRYHGDKMLKQLSAGDFERAQLGLGHSYSRAKVKFNVNRNDNMIIQAIAILDQLDKDINTFSMRMKEWYSWHFPELSKIVGENYKYALVAKFIGDKNSVNDEILHDLAALVDDDKDVAQSIISSARVSMGQDISAIDLENISAFAERVIKLSEYRRQLHNYLVQKMSVVAPNLAELIGEMVGARLISHAGSLTNLSKCPASTVQILGAEKALFRALKTRGNTPKYGIIYHSSFIGKAGSKNKGRISRFLANKCSIASRIDNFSDIPSTAFGEVLRRQVDERLGFYDTGVAPTRNSVAMSEAYEKALSNVKLDADEEDVAEEEVKDDADKKDKKSKKEKKEKKEKGEKKEKSKKKRSSDDADEDSKKSKKKKKSHKEE
ncbi:U3 snoRNP protein Nop56 [Schizosaccharomyces octosporus yFS286]|uniref:Nucleolar protein 56 n=1 Tax=Schizosaccharomyces octosporus (strain yFS286) TaxID=483514 RepID=S9Q3U9_SCHOY|nr:U3 snoRNP protein Nop56 [Schizosaccharomyces octosporus yFS286]EPX74338.1 U3 snoRNP protein Nop56 [Schizosaccharomyces octosporus yFS286]